MPKNTETGMLYIDLEANSRREKDLVHIEFEKYDALDNALAKWLAQKMKETNHNDQFTSGEMRTIPWMPSEVEIFAKTGYCSLGALSSAAYRIVHADPSGLTPQGKRLKQALRSKSIN